MTADNLARYNWSTGVWLSERVKTASIQLRKTLDEKAEKLSKSGVKLVDLSDETNWCGEHEYVRNAVKRMLDSGLPPGELRGLSSLREVIAEKEREEKGIDVDPETDVMVTGGGSMQALNFAIHSTIGPGDEVLIPSPGISFDDIVKLAGGTPVYIPLREEEGFRFDYEAMEHAVTPRTKMMIFNSPHNPTAKVFDRKEVEQVAEFAKSHDLIVLSDEIHEKNVWDGREHVSIASLPGMRDRTIISCGTTKCYHMFRYRIGWVIGNESLMDAMDKIMMYSCQFPPPLTQAAAEALLRGIKGELEDFFREGQLALQSRRDLMWDWLNKIDGFKPYKPQGTFLSYSDTRALDRSSMRLAEYILDKAHVLTAPGLAYLGEGHLRISYDRPKEEINEGMARVKEAVGGYEPRPRRESYGRSQT